MLFPFLAHRYIDCQRLTTADNQQPYDAMRSGAQFCLRLTQALTGNHIVDHRSSPGKRSSSAGIMRCESRVCFQSYQGSEKAGKSHCGLGVSSLQSCSTTVGPVSGRTPLASLNTSRIARERTHGYFSYCLVCRVSQTFPISRPCPAGDRTYGYFSDRAIASKLAEPRAKATGLASNAP